MLGDFAVLDTETNWDNRVMSVGIVLADGIDLTPTDTRYFVLTPEAEVGGMFSSALWLESTPALVRTREEAIREIREWLAAAEVESIFAYNARFDWGMLPELRDRRWYDIMGLAAYRQYNDSIPPWADCCRSGRLRRGFGVEAILRLLRQDYYREEHNALRDALDELEIMRRLGHRPETYERARVDREEQTGGQRKHPSDFAAYRLTEK